MERKQISERFLPNVKNENVLTADLSSTKIFTCSNDKMKKKKRKMLLTIFVRQRYENKNERMKKKYDNETIYR